jgi:hypothetical protein
LVTWMAFVLLNVSLLKRGRLKSSNTYSELDRIYQMFPRTHFIGVNAAGRKILTSSPLVRGSEPEIIHLKF